MTKIYDWAIVGAGPAGLAAIGQLLDQGAAPKSLLWIDPEFQVGDLGKYWGEVSSNTKVKLFSDFLLENRSFGYDSCPIDFTLNHLDPEDICELQHMVDPLQWVSDQLVKRVKTQRGKVRSLKSANGTWALDTDGETLHSRKVILATGAVPKTLNQDIDTIDIETALKPSQLNQAVSAEDTVAVFGSSHSAMIIVRSLIEAGVKKVINFYRSPIRYAIYMDHWILYDNTGLKGETARWTRQNISQHCLPNIERYHATQDNLDNHLPRCTKAVEAVGFESRHLPAEGVNTAEYDASNGIIAPGLFGLGIAYPQKVTDPLGKEEMSVGIWKFLVYLRSVLPIWMQYDI
ncbi:MAG: pyridine nucleotide-disulfide oxidoreductase [Gammaproteobacteria bacterium CG11_big_fil_rev_8_21_14_0_20_46_22]|nr:MAG: pyridine nucleotide-disulfide oxidoreductase [Gammaproteobacteria bacterium CG12_big_fil_rev_8_21_14_0_65_46_12]PIR11518.1 MAG: pyridine nucleotide-disulfide oxidoreductase [Gammaproteobacteria bacterium CG11_big_fil_rev_8_21_14_0_20_46_22]